MASEDKKIESLPAESEQLISPEELEKLEEWADADAEYEAKRDAGWLTSEEFAKKIDEEEINLVIKIERLKVPDKLYTVGSQKAKGRDLRYTHMVDSKRAAIVSPQFQDAWLSQEDKHYKDWMTLSTFSRYIHLGNSGDKFQELWKKVIEEGEIGGVKTRTSCIERGPNKTIYINAHDARKYKDTLPDQKTEEWLTKREFSVFLRCNKEDNKFESLWDEIVVLREFQSKPISIELKKSGTNTCPCIARTYAEKYKSDFRDYLDFKNESWLNKSELIVELGLREQSEVFKTIWSMARQEKVVDGRSIKGGIKKSLGTATYCIHISAVDLFREKMAELKAASQVKPNGRVQKDSIEAEAIEESRGKQNGK